jgi:PKD repeat protein
MLTMVFMSMLLAQNHAAIGESAGTMKIQESTTGSNAIILGDESTQMPRGGYPFVVNVTIEGQFESLYTFQVAVRFDKTKVNFTSASIPTKDPDFVFFDKVVITSGEPLIDSGISRYAVVTLGATLILESINVSKGLLCTLSFMAQRVGDSTIDFSITDGTFLLNLTHDQNGEPKNVDIPFTPESFSVSIFAAPSPPVALFEFVPAFPDVNANITFDSSKSYDPVGNITLHAWDFDDGTTFLTTNITTMLHLFNASRIYYVNLTIYNNFGFSSSIVQEIQVGHVPVVNFTYSPMEVMSDETLTFDASLSHDTDGTIAHHVWNFGDNSPVFNSTESNAIHTYSQKGVYWVRLTVYDNNGLYDSTSQEVFIGKRPTVQVTFAPERPFVFDAVSFNASGTRSGDVDDHIVMLRWEFGDHNITEVDIAGSNPPDPFIITHMYYSGQSYNGNVTAFDNNGLYSTYAFELEVQDRSQQEPNYVLCFGIAVAVMAVVAVAVILVKRRKK